jgi:hypothetical protein
MKKIRVLLFERYAGGSQLQFDDIVTITVQLGYGINLRQQYSKPMIQRMKYLAISSSQYKSALSSCSSSRSIASSASSRVPRTSSASS